MEIDWHHIHTVDYFDEFDAAKSGLSWEDLWSGGLEIEAFKVKKAKLGYNFVELV